MLKYYNMQEIGLQKEGTNMKTKYLHICIVSVVLVQSNAVLVE